MTSVFYTLLCQGYKTCWCVFTIKDLINSVIYLQLWEEGQGVQSTAQVALHPEKKGEVRGIQPLSINIQLVSV